ncbi:NAD-dependent epimerase/dehydratase family protein [Pseudonocardia spinosispora]|uniref:NAD-dependent epimerase/dehydratase family protein n=1 Tax=Pseudonocardia spinosispora TaxID=103441 RepID=UPI0004081C09|nr:NAD(P)-dependent oxidoreductase [Pseudonocardia spinosispora]
MRIFVAGATGAIGRQLVPLLVEQGHQVTGTSRSGHGVALVNSLGAEGVLADALDAERLHEAVGAAAPDVIVHQLTALGELDFAAHGRVRREGTRNLVDAARAAGVTRMLAQSIAWAYEAGGEPADETTPLDVDAPAPRSGTIGSVRALEEAVTELDDHVILRYGLLYGPGTWYSADEQVARQLRAGELTADAAVSSFVHVEDAALAALAALDWPAGAVNVVDDEPAAARDWLPALAEALGEPAPPVATDDTRAGWQRGATNALARNKLGWTPRYPTWRTGFTSLS